MLQTYTIFDKKEGVVGDGVEVRAVELLLTGWD